MQKKTINQRIADLRTKIDKMPMGKRRFNVQKQMWSLMYRARQAKGKSNNKRRPKATVNSAQLQLPGFANLDTSKLEQAIAERILQAALKRVENHLQELAESAVVAVSKEA